MGGILSRVILLLFQKKEVRILVVGLDGAGKTTIAYQFKLHEALETIPTMYFSLFSFLLSFLSLFVCFF